jgi:type IV pilus assembly protein PilO
MAQQAAAAVTFQERGFLDRFPWYVQLLVLLALVLAIAFAVDWFLFKPDRDLADQRQQEADALRQQNHDADIIRQNIAEFEKTLEDLNRQFEDLKVRLPEQREVSNIFENVRSLIDKNQLQLLQYATVSKDKEVARDYYTEVPNTVVVAGTYPKVQALFQDLANYQRILNVTDITLEKAPETLQAKQASVKASFTVTAFYISDQNRQRLEQEAQGGAPGTPAAPGAPAAPGTPPPATPAK